MIIFETDELSKFPLKQFTMDKKEKGLADMQEGEFILNESGTFISTDQVEGVDVPKEKESGLNENDKPKDKESSAGPEEKDITD